MRLTTIPAGNGSGAKTVSLMRNDMKLTDVPCESGSLSCRYFTKR
ncbi:hypothetical protein SBV1_370049 [Verrucomicrobia bacterium]|nr:hypothetical protein SBV1_370049 [Verrucomicrobiota bacterium]